MTPEREAEIAAIVDDVMSRPGTIEELFERLWPGCKVMPVTD